MVSVSGISIRDYAKKHGVSYEAVRKQIKRYNAELSSHISTVGKKMYLDDVAVAFLDDRRQHNPVFISQQSDNEQLADLRLQIDALKNELMTTQKHVIELQTENKLMIEAKTKYDLLLESNAEKQTLIDTLREDLKDSRKERDAAQADADQLRRERDDATREARSYQKSIFGLYRKVKS